MGRHASPTAGRRIQRPATPVLIAALAVVALVAGGLVWWLVGSGAGSCAEPEQTVRVSVAPELGPMAGQLLADPLDGGCVQAEVSAEEPLQTVGVLTARTSDRLPEIWVPDSSIWPLRVEGIAVQEAGSMARSPVLLATSRASAESFGWSPEESPGWLTIVGAMLQTGRSVPFADLTGSSRQLAIVLATQQIQGSDDTVSDEQIATLLQVSRTGTALVEVRDAAVRGDADVGVFGATEQDVIASYAEPEGSQMVALYPEEGSPILDYPVTRVGQPEGDLADAVDLVVERLISDDAVAAGRAAGFRGPADEAPDDIGPATGTRAVAPEVMPLEPAEVLDFADQVQHFLLPSRMLVVIDTSTSMQAPAGSGTRITLARDAAAAALSLLPDDYSVGLWTFAYQVDDDRDHVERVPLRALDAPSDSGTQREALTEELDRLPSQLTSGGTGLYDTALAAVREAREQFQEGTVSSVVLLTDGANEDDARGISLQGLIDTLQAEEDPDRPVELIGIALGPESDLAALSRITEATGGRAYSAQDPSDLQDALFEALRQR